MVLPQNQIVPVSAYVAVSPKNQASMRIPGQQMIIVGKNSQERGHPANGSGNNNLSKEG